MPDLRSCFIIQEVLAGPGSNWQLSLMQEAKQYDPEGIFISPMMSRMIHPEVGER